MDTEPTDEQIEAFNTGWHGVMGGAGRAGERTRAGLRAVLALGPTVAQSQAEALREAAHTWGAGEWQEQWMADRVSCDESAVRSTVDWLNAEADRIEGGGKS